MARGKLMCVLALLAASLALSCGSSTTTTTTTSTAGLTIFITDKPLCNVMTYRTVVTGLRLMSQTGVGNPQVFPGASGAYVRVNFAALRDLTTILFAGQVASGTYNQAEITFGPTQFGVFDPTLTPPNHLSFASFANSTQTFNIQPPLTIVKGGIYGLRMDLDVQHSIGTDAQGNLTGNAPPAVALSTVTPNATDGFGRLQDMKGFVISVTNGSTLSQYLGTINVQILSGTADVPILGVNITPDTLINGVNATSQTIASILGGSFVEVDGYVNPQGALVANSVEVENQENSSQNLYGFIGTITSITRDASGQASQLDLYITDVQPASLTGAGTDTIVPVNVLSTTTFHDAAGQDNFASLPFDGTSLQIGQQVVVHGQVFSSGGSGPSVNANSIYQVLQTHQGNFSSALQVGSDDKTGAFWFNPCAAAFQGLPMVVLTDNNTEFVNITGLGALTKQPSLVVKGLLFYELQGGTIRGVSVPPGTLLMLADQVHQLP